MVSTKEAKLFTWCLHMLHLLPFLACILYVPEKHDRSIKGDFEFLIQLNFKDFLYIH